MDNAGRFLARDRGAFDTTDGRPAPEKPITHQAALGHSVRFADGETIAYLALICNCTVAEFEAHYTRGKR